MTAQPGGTGTGGRSTRAAILVIFAVAAIPVALLVFAWVSGHRTDISLDIPRACDAVDASAVQQLTPGGTPRADRSVGTTSAVDSCSVDTTGADLDVAVGADPQQYDAGYRAAHCTAIHATPVTSGANVTCAATRSDRSQALVDEYVWVGGIYEVRLRYQRIPPQAVDARTTAATDRIVATLVKGLPTG